MRSTPRWCLVRVGAPRVLGWLGVAALGALGCSEFDLGPVSDDPTPDEQPRADPPASPWDDVDSGERPTSVFAAAWRDVNERDDIQRRGWRCFPSYEGALPRFGFLDLRTQLLVEVEPPSPDYVLAAEPHDARTPGNARLRPVDATRFVAVSAPGQAPTERRAWLADGVTGLGTDVLAWQTSPWSGPAVPGAVEIVATGVVVALPDPVLDLHVAVDPIDDRVVWFAALPRVLQMAPETPLLFRLPLDEPDALQWWTLEQLRPAETDASGVDGFYPATLHLIRRGSSVLVGTELVGAVAIDEQLRTRGPGVFVVFDPVDALVTWSVPSAYLPTGTSATTVDSQGRPAWLSPSYPDQDGLNANLDRRARAPELVGLPAEPDGALICPQTVALADADAPTAVFHSVIEGDNGPLGSSLLVSHRGERVWRSDGIREGLTRHAVLFDSVIVLPE